MKYRMAEREYDWGAVGRRTKCLYACDRIEYKRRNWVIVVEPVGEKEGVMNE